MSTALPKVLFTLNVPLEHLAPLEGVAEVIMPEGNWEAPPREEILRLIADCEGVISQGELRVDAELLDAAPKLRIVANAAMGIDNLDLEELRKRKIVATNTPDAFAESTADHTMGLLLSLTRRIAETDRFIRTGLWEEGGMAPLRWESTLAGGKTLGIIGYGRIAQMVEKRARAFDLKVIHTRANLTRDPNRRSLEQLLRQSDIVVALLPLTEETHHLINADALSKMKRGAFFINVARGKIMDEAAVIDALKSERLAGAAFDVFEEEPIVSKELFTMDNVVMTPHTAGATWEQRRSGRIKAAINVERFLKGLTLTNTV